MGARYRHTNNNRGDKMSMTKKNYIAFADMMAKLKPEEPHESAWTQEQNEADALAWMYYKIMEGMCEVFKEDNPRFDAERFAEWVGKKASTD